VYLRVRGLIASEIGISTRNRAPEPEPGYAGWISGKNRDFAGFRARFSAKQWVKRVLNYVYPPPYIYLLPFIVVQE